MPKTFSEYVCQQCGAKSPNFLGKCPECGAWGSLVETVVMNASRPSSGRSTTLTNLIDSSVGKTTRLKDVAARDIIRLPTGIAELDLVLGSSLAEGKSVSGVVPGSVVLIAGEPGIGKSTLLLQLAMNLAAEDKRAGERESKSSKSTQALPLSCSVLYITGEESPQQVKLRADRIGEPPGNLHILAETDVDRMTVAIEALLGKQERKLVVIVDSIQTIVTTDLAGVPGSVGQVRETAARLTRLAKIHHFPLFLVGHVTKEGAIAGPKVLEHLVDVVIWLEGSRDQSIRVVRGIKNRFGPTDEVGIFTMTETGMREVANPSALFLEESSAQAPGSVVTAVLEGSRVVLVEIQALVVPTAFGMPRRVAAGLDYNRLQLLLAVLTKHAHLPLGNADVYVNVVGGLSIHEPAADLAVALAVASSSKNSVLPKGAVAFGEVGLQGEVRSVTSEKKRVMEAKRLGFGRAITPATIHTIAQAFTQLTGGIKKL